jgi:hypothetical protein
MRDTARHLGKNVVIVAALLAVGFFAAWLRFRSYLGDEGAFSDGARTYDTQDAGAVRYAVWETPERLSDAINTSAGESRPALSPDGRWMVFVVGERGLNSDLYLARMKDGKPVDPELLTALDTAQDESSPAFAGDGLYFASDRLGGAGGLDLYRAPYADGVFGAAERLGGGVNSPLDDCDPAPRPGTRELAFASNRRGSNFDLYRAAPAASTASGSLSAPDSDGAVAVAPIEELNSPRDEREPAFTADGRTLFFASNREKASADFDLYRSVRSDDAWSAPVALAGLNSEVSERAPLPAFDDFSLYFSRDSGANGLDLLRARSIELFRLPGRPVGWLDLVILGALLLLALMAWLAKRWPKLDTLYKCYLISLIVHLLLLLWFQGLFVDGGGTPRARTRDAIRVRVLPSAPTLSAANRERAGRTESERTHEIPSEAPPKMFTAELDSERQRVSPAELEAPHPSEPTAPARRAAATDASAPSPATDVALADQAQPRLRSEAAPALDLAPRSLAGQHPSSAGSGPESRTSFAVRDGGETPSAATSLTAPASPAARAPARNEAALLPSSPSAVAAPVAIAAPKAELSRISGGSSGLSLDALADLDKIPGGAPSERGAGIEPQLSAAGSRAAESPDSNARPSTGWITALAPTPELEDASSGDRQSAIETPPVSNPAVGLRDSEPVAKIVEASAPAPGSGAGSSDMLAALAAPAGIAERGTDVREHALDAAPSKHTFAREEAVPPPAPKALALEAPEDRRPVEPPRPEKRWENTPYQNRAGEDKTRALVLNGGTRETEAAVAKGLAYLAKIQRPTGGWGDVENLDEKYGSVAVGKTGLALLAFLGAGHTHLSHTQYSQNALNAVAFLLALQDPESGHFGDSDAYSHGIATYALAECYALSGENALREPLERAVAHILSKQNHAPDPRLFGGWSYYYKDDRVFDRWPRTSITVWQVMALESARLGGLTVPEQVFDDAATFIDHAEDEARGWYRYNHDPSRLSSSWPTLPASTPAALFALSLVGRDITAPEFKRPREFVLTRVPTEYRRGSEDEFVQRGQGNLYFWYYGTLSMFRAGGNAWQRWNAGMKDTLVRGQKKDGSWGPIDVYCSYAQDDEKDRSYSTAMCVLSLEVYYRYYLPLLKVR